MDCNWNDPGRDPYQHSPQVALASYALPKSVRDELAEKMAALRYDDVVVISKDAVKGTYEYANLRDMHFGKGKVCATPDRSQWNTRTEIGLVYCSSGENPVCVLVPTVCRNVSRIDRKPGIRNKEEQSASQSQGSGGAGQGAVTGPGLSWTPTLTPVFPAPTAPALVEPTYVSSAEAENVLGFSQDYGRWSSFDRLSYSAPSIGFIGYFRSVQPVPPIPPVPEPGTWLLLGTGLGILLWLRKRRSK